MTALAYAAPPALADDIALDLPWPPSMNSYWRSIVLKGQVRVLISREGREYRDAVLEAVPMASRRGLRGRLTVTVLARPPDRRRRDLDNLLKPLLDALLHAGVYEDDGQIDYLVVERAEPTDCGRVEVVVREVAI